MVKKLILTQKEINKLIKQYNNGTSLRKLESTFKHSRRILSNILKSFDIKIRDNTINSRKFN